MSNEINQHLQFLSGERKDSVKLAGDFDGMYIFLSFDIVNSTAYKSLNPYWTKTINLFREFSFKYMSECFREKPNASNTEKDFCDLKYFFWKNLGDEVIFMFPNPKISELYKLPDASWSVLDRIYKSLETPTSNSSVKVSVKATLWIAEIDEKSELRRQRILDEYNALVKKANIEVGEEPPFQERNINVAINDITHNTIDFLGPDIDTGFRLSHYASHNKLTLDARLAWILINLVEKTQYHNCFKSNAKIVGYETLKGVWNEKPYPIIWYMPEWNEKNLFYYYEEVDEKSLASKIARRHYEVTSIDKLESILSESKQLDYSNYLLEKINNISGKPIKNLIRIFDTNKQIELHLICLCLNENNEILILKRNTDRSYLPNVWDFGCSHLVRDNTIKDSLLNGYSSKIGTEIELLNNDMPINSIKIDREDDKIINALVFIGKVEKNKVIINKNKYSEHRWISYDFFYPNKSIKKEQKSSFVSGFENRFNDVVQFLESTGDREIIGSQSKTHG